jgi:asparagine synthase (glutamine-hydrolysing)
MSGIYGIYRYDGAPVDSSWLERMKRAMAYYGPHGGNSKIEGSVGMGHLLLEVNPEDAFENQPVRGKRGPVVSAARLDNRDALLEEFDVPSTDAHRLSDGHLVSMAFDRWGEDLCVHLQGDWTVAAWDSREQRLLLAKDAFGNGTLYYHQGKGFIAFASSLKALLALPGVVKESDRLRLVQVLVAWQYDAELTAYKGFRRLVWAQAIRVAPDGRTRTWRHWSAAGRELLRYRRDEDYVEAFLEHYTRAVQICLRTQKPLAAQLSGGRDSGSMVSLAAPLLASQGRGLTAFTSVPYLPPDGAGEGRMGNEWEVAHATATMAGVNVKHVPVDAANYGVIQGIEHLLDVHDGPSHASINHFWIQALTEAVSRRGNAAILTGQMGNATVSWFGNGAALLALLQGNPKTALRLFLHGEPNPWLTLKRQLLKPFLTPGLRAFRHFKNPLASPWQSYSALNVQMAKEVDLNGRMRAAGFDPTYTFSPMQDIHLLYLEPEIGIGAGFVAEIAARHSLANLDPTSNLSLLEFILRVPDDQFRHRGQSSWLLRRAFGDRMPDFVVNEHRKGLQAADAGHRIVRELPAFREWLSALDALPEAREMLDMPLMHRCLNDIVAKVDPTTTSQAGLILLRGMGVGMFLHHLADSQIAGSDKPC